MNAVMCHYCLGILACSIGLTAKLLPFVILAEV